MLLKEYTNDATLELMPLSTPKKNMKSFLLAAFCMILIATACTKQKPYIASNTPECIHDEIENNQENSNWMIGSVEEYRFQNKIVYAFLPDEEVIADAATEIKDSDCKLLCQVGGFGGPAVNLAMEIIFTSQLHW
jgi:hypothetical protein